MRGSVYDVEQVVRQLTAIYCPLGTNFAVELSPHSSRDLPLLLYKRGEKVQAIIVIFERSLDRAKLEGMHRPGSPVYEEMCRCDCRVVNVFTKKKPRHINTRDLAFNCTWVYDLADYQKLEGVRLGCFLFPHNQFVYDNYIKGVIREGLTQSDPKRAGVVLPTGWGKTFLMARILFDNPRHKALIVCPTRLIRDQFKEVLEPIKKYVTIMTYQALLMKHNNELVDEDISEECLQGVEIALFDEIHHSLGDEYRKAVSHFLMHYNPKIALGFTATPMGGKDRGQNSIDAHFGRNEIVKVTFNEAWEYNLLPTPSVICPTSKRLMGEPEWSSLVKTSNVLPHHIQASHIMVDDKAMDEMIGCLQHNDIRHVLYFIDVWEKYPEAERIMQRALLGAGYTEGQYQFWALKGDEETDSSQRRMKLAYEKEPEGEVKVHVLFGAVMIKEGYHPKCRVDMAVIGYAIKSENMIIQMIGRTQFVQSRLRESKGHHPVVVDFLNTTSVFRKEADYINLSGKSPLFRNRSGLFPRTKGRGPLTLIGDTKLIDGDKALANFSRDLKVNWGLFLESLEEFYANTHSVPGECTGYLESAGGHNEKNKSFFYYFSLFLVLPNEEFHKPLVNWLTKHNLTESLRWTEPDPTHGVRVGSLIDFFAISEAVVHRAHFYETHISQYESTMGAGMVMRIQDFADKLCTILRQQVFELFENRYGVLPSPAMAAYDNRLTNLFFCCRFLSELPKPYYMGNINLQELMTADRVLLMDWYRVLRAIETTGKVSERMSAFVAHLDTKQWGKEEMDFLQLLELDVENAKQAQGELMRLANVMDKFFEAEPHSDRYYLFAAALYNNLFRRTTNVRHYIQLIGHLVMERAGLAIRLIGCMAQDRRGYWDCFGTRNNSKAQELITQYKELYERLPAETDKRQLQSALKAEMALLMGKEPSSVEVDFFVKRIKRGK